MRLARRMARLWPAAVRPFAFPVALREAAGARGALVVDEAAMARKTSTSRGPSLFAERRPPAAPGAPVIGVEAAKSERDAAADAGSVRAG